MLHLTSCESDLVPVRLAEPPIIACDNDDVTIWRFDDGATVLRIGSPTEIGADAILISKHLLHSVWTGLRDADGGDNAA